MQEVADTAIAVGTVVLAALTGLLAIYTKRLGDVTQRPSVVAVFEPSPHSMMYLNLEIANEGTAAAFDVKLKLDPPIPPLERGQKSPAPFANLSLLGAGQRMSSFVTSHALIADTVFQVTISWARKPGAKKRDSVTYSLAPVGELSRLGHVPIIQIADEMKKLREHLERASRGRSSVNVYTREDRASEAEEERKQRAAWKAKMEASAAAAPSTSPADSKAPQKARAGKKRSGSKPNP